jgi:hypothetical protein
MDDDIAISVGITETGNPGCEAGSRRLDELLHRSLTPPGQLGARIVRPAPGRGLRSWQGSETAIRSTIQSKTPT